MKKCKDCEIEKDDHLFYWYVQKNGEKYARSYCKKCWAKRVEFKRKMKNEKNRAVFTENLVELLKNNP